MWFFRCPQIYFGDEALCQLEQLQGERAFIVTDAVIHELGFTEQVIGHLAAAGIESQVFAEVEPDPSAETVERAAQAMQSYSPDWIIGLGGGSSMDCAKAAWFRYERPDLALEELNPLETMGLRAKAHLVAIPTTAGSGSEVSQAALISFPGERRKVEMGSYEIMADIAIVDPLFTAHMPPALTADSGIDVLSHAIDCYDNAFSNDFTAGMCLQAALLVSRYLKRAVDNGADDPEARSGMANAATIAGIAIANTNISLAHALGHSAGAVLHQTHGRVTALFVPLTLEYFAQAGAGNYLDMARLMGLCSDDPTAATLALAEWVRDLIRSIGLPLSLQEMGIPRATFDTELEALYERAELSLGYSMPRRVPDRDELRRLFEYAYNGRRVDF